MLERLNTLFICAVFIAIGIGIVVAGFVFPFISPSLLKFSYIAWFIFLLIILPVSLLIIGKIQEKFFYDDYTDGIDLLVRNIAAVVSFISVIIIISLVVIKTSGIDYVHNIINGNMFSSDGYQSFLNWIQQNSGQNTDSSGNNSILAYVLDINNTLHWFVNILPSSESLAYYVVFVIAAILAIIGFLLSARSIKKIYLAIVNYFVFSPILFLIIIFIGRVAVSIFWGVVAMVVMLVVCYFFLAGITDKGGMSGTNVDITNPDEEGNGSEWLHRYGDTSEHRYHIENQNDDHPYVRDEQGNQFIVHRIEKGKYEDDSHNVYFS